MLKNTTKADATNIVDYYIDFGIRSSVIFGGIIGGLFTYWFYFSLKAIATNQKDMETVYMGPEIVAPRPSDPAIQYVAVPV